MAKAKKKQLPKDFEALLEKRDLEELKSYLIPMTSMRVEATPNKPHWRSGASMTNRQSTKIPGKRFLTPAPATQVKDLTVSAETHP